MNQSSDEGITGTSTKKRDGFNRMIADCEAGKINLILTKEVSRFARNTVDTLNYTRRLSELKIGVIFMNDGIDTRDKGGELRLTIMSSIAQEESRKISERVKWGMRRRMENGVVLGCGRIYGYKVVDRKLEIVPEEAEIIKPREITNHGDNPEAPLITIRNHHEDRILVQ
ncbi:MAG: recombinase family protein [Lachnospiraceae bacterium]|nr:recombinase family protein [Ruminococcus sp.]MCM1276349.1 recombinase family protein [Lachnospiraceae bacterium]